MHFSLSGDLLVEARRMPPASVRTRVDIRSYVQTRELGLRVAR